MKYILIALLLVTSHSFSQNNSFYKTLSSDGVLKFYSQINSTPVLISHGDIVNENILPNYTKGLQFMQAPGLFSSESELYNYFTNNSEFYFDNSSQPNSYYNKNASHSMQRVQYYNNGLEVYNESITYNTDEEALESPVWDLISNVRYQLIFRETYIKENDYEFLLLTTINVLKAGIDVNSNADIQKIRNYFLRALNEEETKTIKKSIGSYCLIKESGVWKACSATAVFQHLQAKGYLQSIKDKVNSSNFYDVTSTVANGSRQYVLN